MHVRIAILLLIVLLNGGYAALMLGLLRRRPSSPRWLAGGVILWTATMTGLFLVMIFSPHSWQPFLRDWFYLPMAVQMIWNLLFIQLLFLGAILATLILGRWRPARRDQPPGPDVLSRRKFVYLLACGAAPATALGMGVHGTLTRDDVQVRRLAVSIRGLPPELEGLTIAHVSDLHSGIFCGPKRLEIIRRAANDLQADLVLVTGDIINNHLSDLDAAMKALQGIQSRYGTYLSEGNHDVIPGPGQVRDACNAHRLPMLYNERVILQIRGRRLIVGGLPWMRGGYEEHPEIVSSLFPPRQEGDVRVLLAHHPHLFDIADSSDLVLAGHTHGGQIMLGPLGFGPLFFKYWSGLYRRGTTSLVVSNGCGDWFPCRIGAAAEVGLLTLTRATG